MSGIIRTRHLGDGRISQTIDGKRIYRGRAWDFPTSPDSLSGAALEAHLKDRKGERFGD